VLYSRTYIYFEAVSTLESKTAYTLDRRIIQNFMDIIILTHLKNNSPMSGYDVIKYLHKKFGMLPSSGAVYSLMYSLERKNLIKGNMNPRKRVYKLTSQGEKILREIRVTKNHIHAVFSSVFSEA
jgi:DNA-binding PadR family transcriptional regulator